MLFWTTFKRLSRLYVMFPTNLTFFMLYINWLKKTLLYWHSLTASTVKRCKAKLVYISQENAKMRANLILLERIFGYALTESEVSKRSPWALNRCICICSFSVFALLLCISGIITLHVGTASSTFQASKLMSSSTFLQYAYASFDIKRPIFLTLPGH